MMRCDICLSRHGGSLGLCPCCLKTIYPHGLPSWVLNQTQAPVFEGREHPVLQA